MAERERQFIPGLGFLLLAIILLGAIGSLLHDAKGVPLGIGGAFLWGGAVLVSFVLGTAYISRRLLPLQGNLGWSKGFRLLWRNYTMGAANLLYGRQSEPPIPASKRKKINPDELSPSFRLLSAGFLYSHQAVAITRGNGYSRADGPGLIFLGPGESIARVFDLRPQSRKQLVSAMTRDGIPVETSVSVTFRVRRPSATQRRPRSVENDPIPYPYDKDALFDLTYTAGVAGDGKRAWTEQVTPQAATMLITEIGKYTLDALLAGAGAEPLAEIRERIKSGLIDQQTTSEFQTISRGIDILGVGVGPLELPAGVTANRLATWQVTWKNRISEETVSGDIDAQRLYAQARARAQVENIENLLTSIEALRNQSGIDLHEVVMLRLMEILESASAYRTVMPIASRAALTTLASEVSSEIRQALDKGEA